MAEAAVIHPVGFSVLNSYLRSRAEVTDLVSTRIGRVMPGETAAPRFPALRITDLSTIDVAAPAWARMYFQIDAWAGSAKQADVLARTVIAVLRVSGNFIADGGVLGGCTDLAARNDPDTSLTPSQDRSIVTGHVWLRPVWS